MGRFKYPGDRSPFDEDNYDEVTPFTDEQLEEEDKPVKKCDKKEEDDEGEEQQPG